MFNVKATATIPHNPKERAPFLGGDEPIKSMVMEVVPDDLDHIQIIVGDERLRAKLDDLQKVVDGFRALRSARGGGA